jgi:hypothetical protein
VVTLVPIFDCTAECLSSYPFSGQEEPKKKKESGKNKNKTKQSDTASGRPSPFLYEMAVLLASQHKE